MTNTDTPAVAWYWTDCGIEFFARDGQPHPDHAEPLYRRAAPADMIPATDDLHRHAVEIYGTARNLGPDNLASFARNCLEQFVLALLNNQPGGGGVTDRLCARTGKDACTS
jgi:hypothetical protein